MISSPAVQPFAVTGGGFFSNIVGSITGQGQPTGDATQGATPTQQADGSVGLFDGVLRKTMIGAATGVGVGFLPFIPGGPILGGIVGSIVGAGIGIFQNFKKIRQIQQENQAYLAAAGVQPVNQADQAALLSGNISQSSLGKGSAVQAGPVQMPTQAEMEAVIDAARKGDPQAQQAIGLIVQAAEKGDAAAQQVALQMAAVVQQQDNAAKQAVGGTTQASSGAAANSLPPSVAAGQATQGATSVAPTQGSVVSVGGGAQQAAPVTREQLLAQLQQLLVQLQQLQAALSQLEASKAA